MNRNILNKFLLLTIILNILTPVLNASELATNVIDSEDVFTNEDLSQVSSETTVTTSEASEVASETSEVASETSEVASETSEVASEISEVASETSEVASETSEAASETSEAAGETSEKTSEASEKVSETTEETSTSSEVVSEVSEKATTVYYDEGDAPLSYGRGKIELADYNENKNQGFYLGFDPATFDESTDDATYTRDGLGDDRTPTAEAKPHSFSEMSPDDETGFLYHVQDAEGNMQFDATADTIDLVIPYDNAENRAGQIVVWIDFDGNGSFDANESTSVAIEPQQAENPGRIFEPYDNMYRNGADVSIPLPSELPENTFMRVLLTDETGDISSLGNENVYTGMIGEVEDYPVKFVEPGTITEWDSGENMASPKIEYDDYTTDTTITGAVKSITYNNIQNPSGKNFDLKITTEDPERMPLVEPG